MLELRDLSFRIGARAVLDHASASIPVRARVGLVGRNGSGKTTLFRIIAGELALTGGEVRLPARARIGRLLQEAPDGPELQLAPAASHPAGKTYQEALYQQGQAAMMFYVDDIQAEYDRLKEANVKFTQEPTKTTGSTIAILDDTVGNLIQLTKLSW